MAKDYYSVLGVSKNATDEEIKSAYRKLAKKHHPDLNKDNEESQKKFQEINEANEVLSNKTKRANFDKYGSADGPQFGGSRAGGGFSGFNSGGFSSQGFSGFDDIFNIFSGFGSTTNSSAKSNRGEDIAIRIDLTLEEAALGINKKIDINRMEECKDCKGTGAKGGTEFYTCSSCGGSGKKEYVQQTIFGRIANVGDCKSCNGTGKQIKEKCATCSGNGFIKATRTISVNIPSGIDEGQIMTVKGEGNAGHKKGAKGDLKLVISIKAHTLLKREGTNLYISVPIPFTLSILGGPLIVPGIKEKIEFNIPPLTQTGSTFKIKNKGIKYLNKDSRGDLFVTIEVEMPKTLDKSVKKLLEEIDENLDANSYSDYKAYLNKLNKK
ncbi:MAG: molecular chaperone DnaJ [Clostridia bacterium]|nr:molecular chaperone DnaJ [Clostridia bacterium]